MNIFSRPTRQRHSFNVQPSVSQESAFTGCFDAVAQCSICTYHTSASCHFHRALHSASISPLQFSVYPHHTSPHAKEDYWQIGTTGKPAPLPNHCELRGETFGSPPHHIGFSQMKRNGPPPHYPFASNLDPYKPRHVAEYAFRHISCYLIPRAYLLQSLLLQ